MKWLPRSPMKRLHVKVKPLKLQGLSRRIGEDDDDGVDNEMVVVEMVWKGAKSGLMVPFYKQSSRHKRNRSSERIVGNGHPIEWVDEFESLCDFSVVSKGRGFCSWDVSLKVLHRRNGDKRSKLTVAGKVSLDLADLLSKMECSEIEREVPITLNVDGVVLEATLVISVSFAEVRGPPDTAAVVQSSSESIKEDGFFKMVKGLTGQKKNKKSCQKVHQLSSCDSDDSLVFTSYGLHGNESTTMSESSSGELSLRAELESPKSSETQLEPTENHIVRLFSWRKRRLSFRSFRRKTEPLITSESKSNETDVDQDLQTCPVVDSKHGNCWEAKELISRDGQSRLKANVFFASFDQRSEKAAGESACTALVAVVAHWLHSNKDIMPTRLEFDSLIKEGSLEWRKLCDTCTNSFPDKHFDLETILEANLGPITVLQDKCFTGFFSPDKFDCLKDAMSFDEIWNEINSNRNDSYEPRVYIVSWNDHFFVLKVESNAYYIIDSLGERLFEGCNQAYMLKFDESSIIYGKAAHAEQESDNSEETGDKAKSKDEADDEVICVGKECCREYFKRFLAAISVRELEEEEKKGTASTFSIHQRLQIDFHYSSSSSSPCSPSTDFLM